MFTKVAGPATVIKFTTFLKIPFLKNICDQVFFFIWRMATFP